MQQQKDTLFPHVYNLIILSGLKPPDRIASVWLEFVEILVLVYSDWNCINAG